MRYAALAGLQDVRSGSIWILPKEEGFPACLAVSERVYSAAGEGVFPEIESATNEQARCALRASSYHAVRVVHCDFWNGVQRLNGSVSSFYRANIG